MKNFLLFVVVIVIYNNFVNAELEVILEEGPDGESAPEKVKESSLEILLPLKMGPFKPKHPRKERRFRSLPKSQPLKLKDSPKQFMHGKEESLKAIDHLTPVLIGFGSSTILCTFIGIIILLFNKYKSNNPTRNEHALISPIPVATTSNQ
ncbi:unnamed protein product [Gordionus sp. m RMFG-2023]